MEIKTFFDNFGLMAEAPNGIQKLREMILQLAVQGKMVPQDPKDEPASVLIEKIQEEKERLHKTKGIRKAKALQVLDLKDFEYCLPVNWELVLLDQLCYQITDGTHYTPTYPNTGIPFLSVKDVSGGKIDFSNTRYISLDEHKTLIKRCNPEKYDVLLTKVGTTGIARVIDTENEFSVFVSLALLKFPQSLIYPYFLELLLNSPLAKKQSKDKTQGIGNKNLVIKHIRNFILFLPPYQEQKRIVEKVDELLAHCDDLESREKKTQQTCIQIHDASIGELITAPAPKQFNKSWKRIRNNFDLLYGKPENVCGLRKAILQLAVQGKLVPQDPDDEPASVLLEKIMAEKVRLIKDGKIKKPKIVPPIKPDEMPYKLPIGWELARIAEFGEFCGGGTPSKMKSVYWDGDISWVSPKDMKSDHIKSTELTITQLGLIKSRLRLIPKYSILIVARSGILKRMLPVSINDIECAVNQDLKVLMPYIFGLSDYLQLMLKGHEQFILDKLVKGGMTVQSLKYAEFELQPYPVPPYQEQKRIIKKVDELMALCDELEGGLIQSQSGATKLLESAVAEMLAA